MERLKINFKGRVQGVGFRFQAFRIANNLNLTGNVKNMYDGSVVVHAQGKRRNIDAFIDAIKNERFIRVESVDIMKLEVDDNEKSFEILYWYGIILFFGI